jgi:hypothetical protein
MVMRIVVRASRSRELDEGVFYQRIAGFADNSSKPWNSMMTMRKGGRYRLMLQALSFGAKVACIPHGIEQLVRARFSIQTMAQALQAMYQDVLRERAPC